MTSFVFQNHCVKEFRLYEAIQVLPDDKIVALSPKPESKRNPPLQRDSTVYLWEAGKPQRGLIARGIVVEPLKQMDMPQWQRQFCQTPHQPARRAVIQIEHIYAAPLRREKLRANPILAAAKFFGAATNPQGTIFRVEPALESVLAQLR
jgi:hypothetical protein